MTAQVAVMNTLGIALATDSAVTASTGEDTDKIYSSSDKLFQLSEVAPVGIMINGTADLLDMPWETVIKVYRKKLGSKKFLHLSDYANDFFRFVRRFVRINSKIFSQSSQKIFVAEFSDEWLNDIWDDSFGRCELETEESGRSVDAVLPSIINEVAAENLKEEKSQEKIAVFGSSANSALRAKYGKLVSENIKIFSKKNHTRWNFQRRLIACSVI